mmetsp:Transcript_56411/g.138462  ORF Transcript_56411/g.138462 Transcript_56411/m.138462 type:complete len:103 (+) Transcript_56411:212-520(+)|eukprot:CAMPEP_0206249818 /NCGR_PEP_ID=MMETSP0047_2-20121206/21118_1 /ASSEMBLY_ACC=CAM_ASM_000192 /TAXON_ID=195065 /ORGANISM="Chroomonas mesostigmatica_cf, Strain CCMP1168" /LENGTH=102 /DNA_ID=CAMNT_0053675579 /DNA_START=149 /DNA_END=457 /DNA_ORIENTATION=+
MSDVAVGGTSFPSYYGGEQAQPNPTALPWNFLPMSAARSPFQASSASIMPTGSANSWAYPFVDAGLPPYVQATPSCPYQITVNNPAMAQYSGNPAGPVASFR